MGNPYINAEVEKIINNKELSFPLNLAMACAWICGNLKGVNLKILKMGESHSLCEYSVLISATNPTQAKAMADEVVTQMKRFDHNPLSQEGRNNSDWTLLDMRDVLVHIFLESSRDQYALDELWQDTTPIQIPQEYYFSSDDEEKESTNETDRDFF